MVVFLLGFPTTFRQDELLSFVQENISPLAELLEGQAERQLFQLPPRSEGFKLAKVLEVVEMLKGSFSDENLSRGSCFFRY